MGCLESKKDVTTSTISRYNKSVSNFKYSDELIDFSTFFPPGTYSALARNLTKEI